MRQQKWNAFVNIEWKMLMTKKNVYCNRILNEKQKYQYIYVVQPQLCKIYMEKSRQNMNFKRWPPI